jgi:nucleotide-binding universal stress UspA family protein
MLTHAALLFQPCVELSPYRNGMGKAYRDTGKAEASKMGIDAKTVHVAKVHPATAILETAANRDCNLIVMASHGRCGIQRMFSEIATCPC